MDVFPKFIIETDDELGDCLIIAKCTYHKQLVTDKSKVKGGGWWKFNNDRTEIILHDSSHDFGYPKLEDIINCINNKNVYSSRALSRNISDQYKFNYDYYKNL